MSANTVAADFAFRETQLAMINNPCELVHEHGDAGEITAMLADRCRKGWELDRIISHHLPSQHFGGPTRPRLVIYYFKRKKN